MSTGSEGESTVSQSKSGGRTVKATVALVLLTTGLLTMALAAGGRAGPTQSLFELVGGGAVQRYAFWYGLLATGGGLAIGWRLGQDEDGERGTGTQSR